MDTQVRNLLLSRIPDEERVLILGSAEFTHMDLKETSIEPNKPIEFVDFPETGVHSMLAETDGEMVEIATVGKDGMIGIPLLLGSDRTDGTVFCQVSGTAWRLGSRQFLALLDQCPALERECRRYVLQVFEQASLNSACNRLHTIDERCAKWLLLVHDRVDGDTFDLTQEFLAQMLGVRRAGVNLTCSTLQNAGFIKYSRGRITVTNRGGLERVVCACYKHLGRTTGGGS